MRLRPLLFALVAAPFFGFAWWDAAHGYLLPDALWGGDSYAQLGIVNSIFSGIPPWRDASFPGEWAFRDWLPFLLMAASAKALGTDPHTVARFWPAFVMVAGGAVVYALARRMWGADALPLASAACWMGVQTTLLPTSRYFAAMLMVPLALYAFLCADHRLWTRILAGVALGAASLSYIVAFFGLALMLALASLYRVLPWRIEDGPRVERRAVPWRARMWKEIRFAGPIWAAATPVVLLLWGPILLVYGGRTLNPSHLYGDAARGWTAAEAMTPIRELFFHTASPFHLALSLLALVGVWVSLVAWRGRGGRWALLTLLVGTLGTYHYVLTLPLVGDHLVYYRWPSLFLRLAQLLLAFQATAHLVERATAPRAGPLAWPRIAVLGVVALLVSGGSIAGAHRDVNPAWRSASEEVLATADMRSTLAMANWTLANTSREDVFLGLPLDSFALHALTGRKLVVDRRPHANAFVDMDRRYAEAAIMLFGQNASDQRALLDAYSVDYVIVGPLFSKFLVEDPLLTSPNHAPLWERAGIPYVREQRPYDPIGASALFDVIVPTNVSFGPALLDLPVVWAQRGESGDAFILATRTPPPRSS